MVEGACSVLYGPEFVYYSAFRFIEMGVYGFISWIHRRMQIRRKSLSFNIINFYNSKFHRNSIITLVTCSKIS